MSVLFLAILLLNPRPRFCLALHLFVFVSLNASQAVEFPTPTLHIKEEGTVVPSPDGDFAIVSGSIDLLHIRPLSERSSGVRIQMPNTCKAVGRCVFSGDGKRFAAFGRETDFSPEDDSTRYSDRLYCWDVETGDLLLDVLVPERGPYMTLPYFGRSNAIVYAGSRSGVHRLEISSQVFRSYSPRNYRGNVWGISDCITPNVFVYIDRVNEAGVHEIDTHTMKKRKSYFREEVLQGLRTQLAFDTGHYEPRVIAMSADYSADGSQLAACLHGSGRPRAPNPINLVVRFDTSTGEVQSSSAISGRDLKTLKYIGESKVLFLTGGEVGKGDAGFGFLRGAGKIVEGWTSVDSVIDYSAIDPSSSGHLTVSTRDGQLLQWAHSSWPLEWKRLFAPVKNYVTK